MNEFKVWDFQFDLNSIENENYCSFESVICRFHEHVMTLLEDVTKIQNIAPNQDKVENHDDEIRTLVERNKQIKHNIDVKLEELARQQSLYGSFKKDQKLLSQEIKDTHEAFLMAKKYYKKYLKMYYSIESKNDDVQTIFIQFFTESKKESENYSIRLSRTKTGCYDFLSAIPKLPFRKELKRRLKETNNVPGALCCVRQAFAIIKTNKKL